MGFIVEMCHFEIILFLMFESKFEDVLYIYSKNYKTFFHFISLQLKKNKLEVL